MSKLSIVKGENRKENIKEAIKLIEVDVNKAIKLKKAKHLFIKINAIDTNFPSACTYIDAVEAVIDSFYNRFDEITVGDNTFVFTKNDGGLYKEILNKFPKVKLSDLNEFEQEDIEFKGIDGVKIAKAACPRNAFIISLALPKTHDAFVYTGCLKNMFGCVVKGRGLLHVSNLFGRMMRNKDVESNRMKWNNLINVISRVKADLNILDAYEGMEGEGPLFGSSIRLETAMASLNGMVLDKFASRIYGMENVPYLSAFPETKIEIVRKGFKELGEISRRFKLHYNNKYQISTSRLSIMPAFDVRFMFSTLKRSYRLKDKIINKLTGR